MQTTLKPEEQSEYLIQATTELSRAFNIHVIQAGKVNPKACVTNVSKYFAENYAAEMLCAGHKATLIIIHKGGDVTRMTLGLRDSDTIIYRGKETPISKCKDHAVQEWQSRVNQKLHDPTFGKELSVGR